MKVAIRFALALCTVIIFSGLTSLPAAADEGSLDPARPKGATVEEIIRRFADKEKEFKEARDQYTFRQTVKVQTVDGNTVTGEYQETFDVLFDDKAKRLENVVYAPQSTLENGGISMSPEDVDDIRHRLPFVLTSDEIPEYSILYAGQQQEDELHCYVFDIAPKEIVGKKRYFQGRIWVDQKDLQIVKSYGKAVPDIMKKTRGVNRPDHLGLETKAYRQEYAVAGNVIRVALRVAILRVHCEDEALQHVEP